MLFLLLFGLGTAAAVAVAAASSSSTSSSTSAAPAAPANPFLITFGQGAGGFTKSPPPDVPRAPSGLAFLWTLSPEYPYWAGIDSDGQGWYLKADGMPVSALGFGAGVGDGAVRGTDAGWHTGNIRPAGEESWSDKIDDYAHDYVIPVLATAAGALIGGTAGAIVAYSVSALNKLSRGARISELLVDATYAALKSTYERSEFKKTFQEFQSNPYSAAAIDYARKQVASRYFSGGGSQKAAVEAFDQAAILGRAKAVQDIVVRELHRRLSFKDGAVLDQVLAVGGQLDQWAYAYGGTASLMMLDAIIANVVQRMDAGEFGTAKAA